MQSRFRLSAPRPGTGIVLGVVLGIAIVVALFDWNWLRHPVESYLIRKSGRQVMIGDLHVKLGFSLEPTVRLRGVYVENAPWAAKRPMFVAGEALFTFSLESVLLGHPVISRLVLVDADVDMERQADGLRNWRLRHPDDRGPGKVRVLTLEAHRTQLRFVNGAADLELLAAASDLEQDKKGGKNDGLANRIVFKGTYQGASFAGEALAGEVLTFRETGLSFPVRGYMTSGKTRLDLDGFLTDVFDLGPMDAKVRLAGATLSQLHPFLRIQPAASRPYELEAQLVQTNAEYKFSQLKGRIGATDISGEGTYDRRTERRMVRAVLRSEKADLADLAPLVGMHYAPAGGTERPAQDTGQRNKAAQPQQPLRAERLFPARPFRVDALRAVDARVTMNAVTLKAPGIPMLESLRVAAELTHGLLELKAIDLGLAGGHVLGLLSLDARGEKPSARAAVNLQNIQLEKLVPSLWAKARSTGTIRGQVELSGQGNSLAAIFGNATGSFSARMEGGRISNLADAKLGLNAGKFLSVTLRGDRDIAIRCGALAFDVRAGVGKSGTIVLDTEQTHIDGRGTIDLREERVDLLLTPQPKKPGLFTRAASIRVHGSLKNVQVALQERVALGLGGKGAPPDESKGNGKSLQESCGAVR